MMNRTSVLLSICTCVAVLMSGCLPKRIVWSPDGDQAAVIGEQGLYLSDSEGRTSSLLVKGVTQAQWFPDGKKMALLKLHEVSHWSQVEALLPTSQLQALIEIGDQMSDRLTTHQQWEERVKTILSSGKVTSNEVDGIKLYLHDQRADRLPPAVLVKWGKLNDFWIHCLQVGTIDEGKVELGPVLFGIGVRIWDVRVAPNGNALAFTCGEPFKSGSGGKKPVELWLVSATDRGTARQIATHVAIFPDWRADGRTLVYAQSLGNGDQIDDDDSMIGTLVAHEVLDAGGQIKQPLSPNILAGLAMDGTTRVRCLRDGRILFTSLELQLPCTVRDAPERRILFSIQPERQATVARVIARRDEPLVGRWISHFEVSPDELQVSILGEKGRVSVLDLQNGQIDVIQPYEDTNSDPGIRTVPVWRYPNQLCFARPIVGEDKKPTGKGELVLYQDDQTRVISNGWPEEMKKGFLD